MPQMCHKNNSLTSVLFFYCPFLVYSSPPSFALFELWHIEGFMRGSIKWVPLFLFPFILPSIFCHLFFIYIYPFMMIIMIITIMMMIMRASNIFRPKYLDFCSQHVLHTGYFSLLHLLILFNISFTTLYMERK